MSQMKERLIQGGIALIAVMAGAATAAVMTYIFTVTAEEKKEIFAGKSEVYSDFVLAMWELDAANKRWGCARTEQEILNKAKCQKAQANYFAAKGRIVIYAPADVVKKLADLNVSESKDQTDELLCFVKALREDLYNDDAVTIDDICDALKGQSCTCPDVIED